MFYENGNLYLAENKILIYVKCLIGLLTKKIYGLINLN